MNALMRSIIANPDGPDLTRSQTALAFGMGVTYVASLIAAGLFPNAYKLPNAGRTGSTRYARWRIPRADVVAVEGKTYRSPQSPQSPQPKQDSRQSAGTGASSLAR